MARASSELLLLIVFNAPFWSRFLKEVGLKTWGEGCTEWVEGPLLKLIERV